MYTDMFRRVELFRLLKASYRFHIANHLSLAPPNKFPFQPISIVSRKQETVFSTTPTSHLIKLMFNNERKLFQSNVNPASEPFHPMLTSERLFITYSHTLLYCNLKRMFLFYLGLHIWFWIGLIIDFQCVWKI
jgi:hypothetical protein